MNKAELVKELETRLGSRKAANDALAHVVDVIIREVAKGGKVAITGFGTFEKSARAARTGRNPRTGETVRIRKTNVPKFRAGAGFKDVVANPKKLPKAAVAGARAAAGHRDQGCDERRRHHGQEGGSGAQGRHRQEGSDRQEGSARDEGRARDEGSAREEGRSRQEGRRRSREEGRTREEGRRRSREEGRSRPEDGGRQEDRSRQEGRSGQEGDRREEDGSRQEGSVHRQDHGEEDDHEARGQEGLSQTTPAGGRHPGRVPASAVSGGCARRCSGGRVRRLLPTAVPDRYQPIRWSSPIPTIHRRSMSAPPSPSSMLTR